MILDIISIPSNVKHVLAKWKWEDIFMKWPENVSRCQTNKASYELSSPTYNNTFVIFTSAKNCFITLLLMNIINLAKSSKNQYLYLAIAKISLC